MYIMCHVYHPLMFLYNYVCVENVFIHVFIQETKEVLLQQNRKLTEELNHLKTTVNEMSLLLHKMAENQNIDLKDIRN